MSLSSTVFDVNGSSQSVAYTGTSAHSTALPAGTEAVRLCATTDAYVAIVNATATTASTATSFFLPQYAIEYVAAKAGQYVAAVRDSASGSLKVTPLTRN